MPHSIFYSPTHLKFSQTEKPSPTFKTFCQKTFMSANENQVPLEVLQPDISGQIIQTNLEELRIWINDGKLQPHHQVRVKNLSWIEAHKIPALKPLFESKKNGQSDQQNNFFNPPLSNASGFNQTTSDIINTGSFSSNKTASSTKTSLSAETSHTSKKSKPSAEPSAVFKAFEKKALAKSKQGGTETRPTGSKDKQINASTTLPAPSSKSSTAKNTLVFLGGCVLMLLLSYGGAYLWVYQLKSPAAFDEKSVPEVAGLEHKLTSDKLDLRLKASSNDQETISQKYAQLEKKYDAQRKTAIENHRAKLADADFTQTLSFSSVVLLALFLTGRIFYGKTSKPVEYQTPTKSSAKRSHELSDNAESDGEGLSDNEDEFSGNPENGKSSEEIDELPAKKRPPKNPTTADDSGDIFDSDENEEAEEAEEAERCLLHPQKTSVFVCESCENNYCDGCLKTFGELENCCPFCKIVCKSLDAHKDKSSVKKNNKPVNLLDINKENSGFIVYDYEEERSRVSGVIQAFAVALLLSAAVSILWTYKISPYLENRNKDTAQKATPNEGETSGQIPLNADPATYNDEIDDALKTGPCIDPETKQPFECDEETRRALYEHTRKTQSVEKAKKDVLNTAELLSGPKGEKAPDDPQIAAAKAEQSKKETRQLIVSFVISFVLIFGLLLATVFFGKDKKTFLNQNKREEAEDNEEIFEIEIEETDEAKTV